MLRLHITPKREATVTTLDITRRLTLVETGFDELADPQAAHADNTGGWKAELGELVEFSESR
jgi:hypothetical protein